MPRIQCKVVASPRAPNLRETGGTRDAICLVMATIFALILLPAIIGVSAIVNSSSGETASTVGATAFVVLAGGMVYGLLRMSRRWEQGEA